MHTGHANFDFNWCSIFTKRSFLVLKKVRMVKITPCQIPSNWSKNPPAKFPIPGAISALTLNAIYKTLKLVPRSTFLKIFFEKKSFWVICADKLFWKIDGFRDIGDFEILVILRFRKLFFKIKLFSVYVNDKKSRKFRTLFWRKLSDKSSRKISVGQDWAIKSWSS